MPIYEYECSNCHVRFEKLQKISDPDLKHCPNCHAESIRKLISATTFRLKGGGWYETDFKTNQDQKRHLASSDDAKPLSAPAETPSVSPTTPATTTSTNTKGDNK